MKHRIRYWILMVLVVSLLAGCALPGGNSQALAQALERAMAQSPAETAPAETEPPATAAPERVLPGETKGTILYAIGQQRSLEKGLVLGPQSFEALRAE